MSLLNDCVAGEAVNVEGGEGDDESLWIGDHDRPLQQVSLKSVNGNEYVV